MFRVMLEDLEVGRSPLQALDAGMAVATGPFIPSAGYKQVESLFRRLSDAVEARSVSPDIYRERDALGLQLFGPDDVWIPSEAITVYDFGGELERELEVKLADVKAWQLALARGGA